MAALSPASTGSVLRSLREQLGSVGTSTLALLLQVVANTLRVNGAAARALVRLCGGAAAWSRWDALLMLMLLELPRHAESATQATGNRLAIS